MINLIGIKIDKIVFILIKNFVKLDFLLLK
jgi:hypothetical protein